MAIISPSLLSADFTRLDRDIDMINRSEADWLHLDVMDGVFVPNISFGFPVLKGVAKICKKKLDVHLMIVDPGKFTEQVKALGAYMMNVHYEACPHLHRTIQQIHDAGMKAGVTLNPHTPVNVLEDIIQDVDMVLLIEKTGSKALIEVDGGVNAETGKRLVEAGTDVLVAGSYIFGTEDPEGRISLLKGL